MGGNMVTKRCTSCHREVNPGEYVEFRCPACGEVTIVRCSRCRAIGNEYVCPVCGFVGP